MNAAADSYTTGQGNTINAQPTYNQWYLSTGTGAATTTTNYTFATFFALSMLPDYTDFTNLYDQYKICFAKLRIRAWATSAATESGISSAYSNVAALVSSIIDYDDATAPAATGPPDDMRQYPSYKTHNLLGRPVTRVVRPHLAGAVYNGAFTGYSNRKAAWIDCNSPHVQHYGLKYFITVQAPLSTATSYIFFQPEVTLYFKCKNPR